MPGRAGSLQTSCLGTETALAPGDSAWNQPGEAESAPCIQDFPEAGLSLVLGGGGFERERCGGKPSSREHSVLGKELLAGGRTGKHLFGSHFRTGDLPAAPGAGLKTQTKVFAR